MTAYLLNYDQDLEHVGWLCPVTGRVGKRMNDGHRNCEKQHEPLFRIRRKTRPRPHASDCTDDPSHTGWCLEDPPLSGRST